MNKTFKKLMVFTLAGLTLCATAMAAPRGGKGPAPRPAPRHHVPKHRPAPPPKHHGHQHHHGGHHHNKGWVTLGAAVVGGLVGGLVGACR